LGIRRDDISNMQERPSRAEAIGSISKDIIKFGRVPSHGTRGIRNEKEECT
jgi:hypothetical protein